MIVVVDMLDLTGFTWQFFFLCYFILQQERAQSDKGRKKTSTPEDRMTTSSSNIGSPTIENVTLRTKLILDDLYAKCHDLMSDLIQTCN